MSIPKPSVIELFQSTKQIVNRIPTDFGGGSPLAKSFLMAYIALEYDLKNYVEIGIYRGRSFFPMAYVSKLLGGMAYGIDPYDYEIAKEYDLNEMLGKKVNDFLASLDFSKIYENVLNLRQELEFFNNSEIIKEKSSDAIEYFRKHNILIDILHIDGNHDTKYVMEDVDLYLPLIGEGGFIVIDDIDWNSVKPAYNLLREKYDVVFENNQFAILFIGDSKKKISIFEKRIFNFLSSIVDQVIEEDQAIQILTAQVIEKDQAVQTLTAQVIEEDQAIQILTAQVIEKDQAVQTLTAQVIEAKQHLAEIESSRAWHYVKIFRKVLSWFRVQKNKV